MRQCAVLCEQMELPLCFVLLCIYFSFIGIFASFSITLSLCRTLFRHQLYLNEVSICKYFCWSDTKHVCAECGHTAISLAARYQSTSFQIFESDGKIVCIKINCTCSFRDGFMTNTIRMCVCVCEFGCSGPATTIPTFLTEQINFIWSNKPNIQFNILDEFKLDGFHSFTLHLFVFLI